MLYCGSSSSSQPEVTSKHYTAPDHLSSYEAAFFYSPGNDYTTYLQTLVQSKLGILTNIHKSTTYNDTVIDDIETVASNMVVTDRREYQQRRESKHRLLDIGYVMFPSCDTLFVILGKQVLAVLNDWQNVCLTRLVLFTTNIWF